MEFILGHPVEFEESLTCEFKEARGGNPVQTIAKSVDEYAVAFLNALGGSIYWGIRDRDRVVVGLKLPDPKRDELRQVIGQKIATIAPPLPADTISLPIHPVLSSDTQSSQTKDLYVVEVSVRAPDHAGLYLTGGGEAYKKTLGGKKKLTGSELIASLFAQLHQKQLSATRDGTDLWGPLADFMKSVTRRAEFVSPFLRGSRILWIDDIPGHTIYERTAFSALGIGVDIATSSEEALFMIDRLQPDLIISDIRRGARPRAGLEFLEEIRSRGVSTPVIFYVGELDSTKAKPKGSFGITNVPSELFHLSFDALERVRSNSG